MKPKDARLYDLIPHREPMLLIDDVLDVDQTSSSARVHINEKSSFFKAPKGVPSWIGVEYMGQTAALIAGYQLQQGVVSPHLGFLLGTRKYRAAYAWFRDGDTLTVKCEQAALVGEQLAHFNCELVNQNGELFAEAKLSVYRRPLINE